MYSHIPGVFLTITKIVEMRILSRRDAVTDAEICFRLLNANSRGVIIAIRYSKITKRIILKGSIGLLREDNNSPSGSRENFRERDC